MIGPDTSGRCATDPARGARLLSRPSPPPTDGRLFHRVARQRDLQVMSADGILGAVWFLTLVVVHVQAHQSEDGGGDQWGAYGRVRGSHRIPHTLSELRGVSQLCATMVLEKLCPCCQKIFKCTHTRVASDDRICQRRTGCAWSELLLFLRRWCTRTKPRPKRGSRRLSA